MIGAKTRGLALKSIFSLVIVRVEKLKTTNFLLKMFLQSTLTLVFYFITAAKKVYLQNRNYLLKARNELGSQYVLVLSLSLGPPGSDLLPDPFVVRIVVITMAYNGPATLRFKA